MVDFHPETCFYFSLSWLKLGGNYDSHFDVDRSTGTIIIAKPLDAEQKSNYNLTVEATDGTTSILTQVGEWLMAQNSGLGVHSNGDSWFCPLRFLHQKLLCWYSLYTCTHWGFLFMEWKFTINPDLGFECN